MKKHGAIISVLPSKENTSKDIKTDKVEMKIQQKCLQQGVYYIEGKKDENKYNKEYTIEGKKDENKYNKDYTILKVRKRKINITRSILY